MAEIKRIPIKLSILPDVRQMDGQIALAQNKFLSRFVEDLMRKEFNS
ncbi:hypothetical protein [Intestinicryptomonas porci]|uniref:Uncharacterized protein n=1 Tax=Intestinicryptomonas porci TaxID=2926320 RepID=A0ABU4WHW4_9BACT|nr:hypothetical protein [Opitutales bacterium CLA-KB-P66]